MVARVEASEPLRVILSPEECREVVDGTEVPILAGPRHEPMLLGVEIDAVSIVLEVRLLVPSIAIRVVAGFSSLRQVYVVWALIATPAAPCSILLFLFVVFSERLIFTGLDGLGEVFLFYLFGIGELSKRGCLKSL